MKYEGVGTLSAKQPDGTWRVIGTVDSIEVQREIERRVAVQGEVAIHLNSMRFVDLERLCKLETVGASVPGLIPPPAATKRTAPPWKRRHYGPGVRP